MKNFNSRMIDSARASVESVNTDSVLRSLGLQRRPSGIWALLPAASYLLVGAAVGAGIALLFAPRAGAEVRKELSERTKGAREQLGAKAEKVAQEAQAFAGLSGDRSKGDNGTKAVAKAPPAPHGS